MKKILYISPILTLSFLSVISCSSASNHKLPEPPIKKEKNVSNIFALGDSLVDGGVLPEVGNIFVKKHSWISGTLGIEEIKLESPYFENRTYSNGPTAIELISKKFKVPFNTGHYFNAGVWPWNEHFKKIGTNYGVGGARVTKYEGPLGLILDSFSLEKQTNALLKHHNNFQKNDFIYLGIGTNDFISQKDYSLDKNRELITKIVENIYQSSQKLIQAGAKNLIIANVPDYGITPYGKESGDGEKITETIKVYNSELNSKIDTLKDENQQVAIKKFDIFDQLHKLKNTFLARGSQYKFSNATNMNFSDVLKYKGIFKPILKEGVTLDTIDNYFFFDSTHPAKWVHEKMSDYLYDLINE